MPEGAWVRHELKALIQLISGQESRDLSGESLEFWNDLLCLGHRHAVLPLLNARQAPPAVTRFLENYKQRNSLANLAQHRHLEQIMAELRKRRLRAYPYKGPRLAEWAYGDVGRRVFNDLDLVIPSVEGESILACLRQMGYQPCFPRVSLRQFLATQYEYRLVHAETRQLVELKWRFAPLRFGVWAEEPRDWDPQPEKYGPGLEELFVLLVLHGTKHGWSRMQWLCDVKGLLGKGLDQGSLQAHTLARQASKPMALALHLLQKHWGKVDLPAWPNPAVNPRLVQQVEDSWATSSGLSGAENRSFLLQMMETPVQKAAYVIGWLLHPTPSELLAVPRELPRPWLYCFVKPLRLMARWLGLKWLQDPRESSPPVNRTHRFRERLKAALDVNR